MTFEKHTTSACPLFFLGTSDGFYFIGMIKGNNRLKTNLWLLRKAIGYLLKWSC
jgi:hypothetical protein